MTSNFAGIREHMLVERSESIKKKLSSQTPGERIRVWSCVNRSKNMTAVSTSSTSACFTQPCQTPKSEGASCFSSEHEPSTPVSFSNVTAVTKNQRKLQGHFFQRHEQSDEGSVYEV